MCNGLTLRFILISVVISCMNCVQAVHGQVVSYCRSSTIYHDKAPNIPWIVPHCFLLCTKTLSTFVSKWCGTFCLSKVSCCYPCHKWQICTAFLSTQSLVRRSQTGCMRALLLAVSRYMHHPVTNGAAASAHATSIYTQRTC